MCRTAERRRGRRARSVAWGKPAATLKGLCKMFSHLTDGELEAKQREIFNREAQAEIEQEALDAEVEARGLDADGFQRRVYYPEQP